MTEKYADFSKAADLPTKKERLSVAGFRKVSTQKGISTVQQDKNRITLTNSTNSGKIEKNKITISTNSDAATFIDTVSLPNGNKGKIKEESNITKVVTFAGKGTNKELKVAKHLEKQYNVPKSEWKHSRGDGYVICDDGKTRHAELHWFESDKTGKIKMKVKRYFDES